MGKVYTRTGLTAWSLGIKPEIQPSNDFLLPVSPPDCSRVLPRPKIKRRLHGQVQVLLGRLQGIRQGLLLQVVAGEARHQSRRQQTIPMHR